MIERNGIIGWSRSQMTRKHADKRRAGLHASNKSNRENRKDYWNRVYENQNEWDAEAHNWLEAYGDILVPPAYILDMGCGTGAITEHLKSRGHTVMAADISETALTRLRSRVGNVETRILDFTSGLPWENETFDHVVADLCLHYFDLDTTKRLIEDILRILKSGGFLFARVNSTRDIIHGSGRGTLVEPNYYIHEGHYKRFFDRDSIKEVFSPFALQRAVEGSIKTNIGIKYLYEIVGLKTGEIHERRK